MSAYSSILSTFKDIIGESTLYNFTEDHVDSFANRALRSICERARYKDTSELIDVVGGTSVYSVTSDGYDVFRVEYDGEYLIPITRDQLRTSHRDWESQEGLPRYYYLDEIYSAQDYLSVGLFPTPSTNLTDGLRVWTHGEPTAVDYTVPSGQVDVPEWASPAVAYYMAYLAFSAETQRQDFGVSAFFYTLYEDILGRLVARSRDRVPKKWVSGGPADPSRHVLNRLPERVPAP